MHGTDRDQPLLPLEDDPTRLARRTDPDTSKEAAADIAKKLPRLQGIVLEWASREPQDYYGFTDRQLCAALFAEHPTVRESTWRTRRSELRDKGTIGGCRHERDRWWPSHHLASQARLEADPMSEFSPTAIRKTVEAGDLEPKSETFSTWERALAFSTAVSLKRIADALSGNNVREAIEAGMAHGADAMISAAIRSGKL